MLQAYLHGKLPANTVDIPGREDVLTATVFERLRYLRPVTAWRALFGRLVVPLPPVAGWEQEFWPPWRPKNGPQKLVEPDVVWSVEKRPRIIFEVKWGDEQTFEQLEREAEAGMEHGGGLGMLIVGLGGWTAERRRDVLQRWRRRPLPTLVAIDWDDVHRNIREFLDDATEGHERYVLADIVRFLEDRGFIAPRWMETLNIPRQFTSANIPVWTGPGVVGVANLITASAVDQVGRLTVPWSPR